jgi:hypothetical protein
MIHRILVSLLLNFWQSFFDMIGLQEIAVVNMCGIYYDSRLIGILLAQLANDAQFANPSGSLQLRDVSLVKEGMS